MEKLTNITHLIVHHSGVSKLQSWESIRQYHTIHKKWEDIGYHFGIDYKGQLWTGRSIEYVGAHCKRGGMNFKSLSVCLIGNHNDHKPTKEMMDTLTILLNKLKIKYGIPDTQILGHREVIGPYTICPGRYILKWLKLYRKISILQKIIMLYKKIISIRRKYANK